MNEETEKLSKDELAFQARILNKYNEILIARRIWQEHLAEKYSLTEKDGVTADGYIKRNYYQSSPPSQQPPQPAM